MAERLIAPMLAVPSTGSSGRAAQDVVGLLATGDWWLDTKLDGIRSMWTPDGRLLNRKGQEITRKFPEVAAGPLAQHEGWIDGEIVALDGSFETTLMRESLTSSNSKINRAAEERPCRFVAFDLPDIAHGYGNRRAILATRVLDTGLDITPISTDRSLFDRTRELGMEGVIAKRINGRYRPGKRSTDWVKFKHLHRISCLVAGYEPGNGHRAHLGAITLALIDGAGQVVLVGKTGSGFTERQTHQLKARIDSGDILVAEIETTHLTSGGVLRFPVFRGLRTDVAPTDCTTDQLDTLPATHRGAP